MKRLLSFVLILGILATGLTGVAEEKKGLFGSIGDGLSDAWNWTKGAADDVAGWTSKAANDAANWTSGAANDAWNWTSNAANDVADWTSNAATDVWDTVSNIWKKDEGYFCPNCDAMLEEQPGFDPDNGYWECQNCGQMLFGDGVYQGEKYPDVLWFCDGCDAFLNMQTSFNDYFGTWKCTECGYMNTISDGMIYDSLEEALDAQKNEAEDCGNTLKCYIGKTVNTGVDNGYTKENKIDIKDPHYGWELGRFYISGFTQGSDDPNNPVFLKNVGDQLELHFELYGDINALNGNTKISINQDKNGYDEYFGIRHTDFGKGTLIVQHTDYENFTNEPNIYTDFIAARATQRANTLVQILEEGDYEVALDYEIKDATGIIAKYGNYRIAFKFSVRNGNCMVYPRDVVSKSELINGSATENGFYLDLTKSHYLDINVKKEIPSENGVDITTDSRFNRPAKPGDKYTDPGIYTITAYNRYTEQTTEKVIYVGMPEGAASFQGFGDPQLLGDLKDTVYAQLEAELGSDDYIVENVEAIFISQEYIDELAYNSQSNIYFGYTLAELDKQFEGTRYVFTLGEDGNTTVQPFEAYSDDTYEQVIKNVAIGTGVILICVTVSILTAGTATAGGVATISSIFATAAEKGATLALSAARIGTISSGVVKYVQTGNIEESLKAAALGGSKAFKWAAITGTVTGGIGEWINLHPSSVSWQDSENAALEYYKGTGQVSYFEGQEVAYGWENSSRPDVVRMVGDHLDAIEVKNYDLAHRANVDVMLTELKREISQRIIDLPSGSTQRVMLDVRKRGFSLEVINAAKERILFALNDIYPNIPIDVMY